MDLTHSYFAIKNPLAILDRWLNPFKFKATIHLRNKDLQVEWTKRADSALKVRTQPLIAEMQLYFSCVVKKRVLFHEASEIDKFEVNNKLNIAFRPVQATACSPEEFANNFPIQKEFHSEAATKMLPSMLRLDFINGQWQGDFSI